MAQSMFPVGIPPPHLDPSRDGRGLDTINRLLLHGSRHHDRAALFLARSGDVPDWRADRLSIRIALVLQEEMALEPRDVVALWLPLSVSSVLVERGLWGLGAASLSIPPELRASEVSVVLARARPRVLFVPSASQAGALSIPDSVASIVTLDESAVAGFGLALREVLDRGGVLDTPERASRFRATARSVTEGAVASIEIEPSSTGSLIERTQGDWARAAARFARRIPPRKGARHVLDGSGVEHAPRIVIYAGWADGLTTLVLDGGRDRAPAEGDLDLVFTRFAGTAESGSAGSAGSGSARVHFANLFEVTGEENGGPR
jgi:AMP-binding enzyme